MSYPRETHRVSRQKDKTYSPYYGFFWIGARDFFKWKHIKPIDTEDRKIVAARMTVYSGDPEEYTFVTSEAYYSLKD